MMSGPLPRQPPCCQANDTVLLRATDQLAACSLAGTAPRYYLIAHISLMRLNMPLRLCPTALQEALSSYGTPHHDNLAQHIHPAEHVLLTMCCIQQWH